MKEFKVRVVTANKYGSSYTIENREDAIRAGKNKIKDLIALGKPLEECVVKFYHADTFQYLGSIKAIDEETVIGENLDMRINTIKALLK